MIPDDFVGYFVWERGVGGNPMPTKVHRGIVDGSNSQKTWEASLIGEKHKINAAQYLLPISELTKLFPLKQ